MLSIVSCKEGRDYVKDLYIEFTDKTETDITHQNALEQIIEKGAESFVAKFQQVTNKQAKLQVFYSAFSHIRDLRKDNKNNAIFNGLLTFAEAVFNKYNQEALSSLLFNSALDFYNLLSDSSEYKVELAINILKNLRNNKYSLGNSNKPMLASIMLDLTRKEICGVNESKTLFSSFFEYLAGSKNYVVLEGELKKRVIAIANEETNFSRELAQAYFYALFTSYSPAFITSEIKEGVLQGLKTEIELLSDIKSLSIGKITGINPECFDSVYGAGSSCTILKNAKLRVLYNISKILNNTEISLQVLREKHGVTIEDFEEIIFEGNFNDIFSIDINYERNVISIRYTYQNKVDCLKELQLQIGNLRKKLGGYIEKLEEIKLS